MAFPSHFLRGDGKSAGNVPIENQGWVSVNILIISVSILIMIRITVIIFIVISIISFVTIVIIIIIRLFFVIFRKPQFFLLFLCIYWTVIYVQ